MEMKRSGPGTRWSTSLLISSKPRRRGRFREKLLVTMVTRTSVGCTHCTHQSFSDAVQTHKHSNRQPGIWTCNPQITTPAMIGCHVSHEPQPPVVLTNEPNHVMKRSNHDTLWQYLEWRLMDTDDQGFIMLLSVWQQTPGWHHRYQGIGSILLLSGFYEQPVSLVRELCHSNGWSMVWR